MAKDTDKDVISTPLDHQEKKETAKKPSHTYTGPERVWYEGRKVYPGTWTEAEARDAVAKYPKMFKTVFVFA